MNKFNLDSFTNGWFIGNFKPSLFSTNEFEVACKKYKKGEFECKHHHNKSIEYTLIVKGKIIMGNEEFNENNIIVIEKGESVDFRALEDTITMVIKIPSVLNDKIKD